ncbi:MAG: hypothetical protein QM656_04945 [Paracoccaceae bacterium]
MRMMVMMAGLALAGPAAAQLSDDSPEMEMQRCVWRCLADSPGAGSVEYNQCVERQCSDDPAPPAAPTARAPAWQVGTTSDGAGRYAGVSDPESAGHLFYMCDASGQSLLKFQGISGEGIVALVKIDGAEQKVAFVGDGTSLYMQVPVNGAVFAALSRGRELSLLDGSDAMRVARFPLAGSSQAIAAARVGCR